jgi:septal ring factor EnvC (AmiA/AmiB activator)
MLRKKTLLSVALLGAFTLGLASCSNKATEEQMKTLRELDSRRDGLRSELDRLNASLRDARAKLASHDRDLKDCNDDTQFARAELVKWPNVWADSADWREPVRLAPPGNTPGEAPRKSGSRVK